MGHSRDSYSLLDQERPSPGLRPTRKLARQSAASKAGEIAREARGYNSGRLSFGWSATAGPKEQTTDMTAYQVFLQRRPVLVPAITFAWRSFHQL
jgi:hypothetical protein